MAYHSEAIIQAVDQGKSIVRIGLNGYRSFSQDPTVQQRSQRLIWSFTILDGDREKLKTAWAQHTPVMLCTRQNNIKVRVVAFPVEDDGYGLIEFMR